LNGCDGVISSLGTGLSPFREVSLLTVATGTLVTAMTRDGVRRLVCISALGSGTPAVATAASCSTGCSCLCCSAMLTNDPARGSVRAVTDLAGVNGGKIARDDVARFVVEQLNTWLRRTPVLLW
jgi:hypothetical protein